MFLLIKLIVRILVISEVLTNFHRNSTPSNRKLEAELKTFQLKTAFTPGAQTARMSDGETGIEANVYGECWGIINGVLVE